MRIKSSIVSRYYATPHPYDVIVYTENNHYYAKDMGGNTICTDSPTACLQEVVDYVTQKGGGKILVKRGMYYPKYTIMIPDDAKLVIEGEGDATVFRYTDSFVLFYHDPACTDKYLIKSQKPCTKTTPKWSSTVVLKNFKVDRSGSGNNATRIIHVWYGRKVVVKGLTIVDDYRDSPNTKDDAIFLINNIIGIVEGNTILNKYAAIENSSFLSITRDNYIENTGTVGIMGEGLITTYWAILPPGFSPGGLSIIEGNTCVDCGRKDEAIAVDFHSDTLISPIEAIGVIRNNLIMGKNYSVLTPFAFLGASEVIVENNKVYGSMDKTLMGTVVTKPIPNLIIRNNIFRIMPTSNFVGTSLHAYNFVFENNIVEIKSNLNQNIKTQIEVRTNNIIFRRNRIIIDFPSGYYTNYILSVVPFSTTDLVAYIDDNYFNSPINPNLPSAIVVYPLLAPTIAHIRFRNNYIMSSTFTKSILGLSGEVDVNYYTVVKDNTVAGTLEKSISIWNNKGTSYAVLDTDINVKILFSGVAKYVRNSRTAIFSGDGSTTQFRIQHNLVSTPSKIIVTPASRDAASQFYVTADSTYIYVNYSVAPPTGTNNVVLYWYAEV